MPGFGPKSEERILRGIAVAASDTALREALRSLAPDATVDEIYAVLAAHVATPEAIWERARNLGKFSFGFLWAQKNTNPIQFSKHGDQPQWVECHWHGFQLLWGNIYIRGGMALLLVLLAIAVRIRTPTPATASPVAASLPTSVPAQ